VLSTPVPSPSVQRTEDKLAPTLDRLQRVLATDCPGSDREWASGCWYALARLETQLRQHLEDSRADDGPSALIDPTRPSLLRQWEEILHGYRDQLETVIGLKWELYHLAQGKAAAATAREHLRPRLEQIVSALHQNLNTETDIVMESVVTDIGVGD
jgi:hypothetical protein